MTREKYAGMTILIPLMLCMGLALSGVAHGDSAGDVYIAPANLTEQEENIAELIGPLHSTTLIYDFELAVAADTAWLCVYELASGKAEWHCPNSYGADIDGLRGRLAITFNETTAHVEQVTIQSEGSTEKAGMNIIDTQARNRPYNAAKPLSAWQCLDAGVVDSFENEIPLLIQVVSNSAAEVEADMSLLHTPEKCAEYGYDDAFAVTVKFSRATVAD